MLRRNKSGRRAGRIVKMRTKSRNKDACVSARYVVVQIQAVNYTRGIMPPSARGGRRYLAGFTTRQPGKKRAVRPELLAIVKLSTGIARTSISSRVQGN